jgi:hypothetical protein
MRIVRGQATGALHSRTIETRIAAAKSANMTRFLFIAFIIPRSSIGVNGLNLDHRGHRGSQGKTVAEN